VRIPAAAISVPLVVVLFASSASVAADRTDFSGTYTLRGGKGASKLNKRDSSTLRVIQTEATIEIAKAVEGKQNVNRFQLDGSEGEYNNSGGQKGVGKARFKGKTLVLDTLVTARPLPAGPDIQIHTRERWELSSDSKTLTIRSDVDFPNSLVPDFQLIQPWSEVYTRN